MTVTQAGWAGGGYAGVSGASAPGTTPTTTTAPAPRWPSTDRQLGPPSAPTSQQSRRSLVTMRGTHGADGPQPPSPAHSPNPAVRRGGANPRSQRMNGRRKTLDTGLRPHPFPPPPSARGPPACVGSAGAAARDPSGDGLRVRKLAPPGPAAGHPHNVPGGGRPGAKTFVSPRVLPGSAEAARTPSSKTSGASTSRRCRRSGRSHLRTTGYRLGRHRRPPPARSTPLPPPAPRPGRPVPRRHAWLAGLSAPRMLRPPPRCARSAPALRPPPGRAGGGTRGGAGRSAGDGPRGARKQGLGRLAGPGQWAGRGVGNAGTNPCAVEGPGAR